MQSVARPKRGLVRRPSPRLAEGEVTHIERTPLDVDRAVAQHATYVALLERLGITIIYVEDAPEHPDGIFVEDALVMVDDFAVITRPGAPSRRNETVSMLTAIEKLALRYAEIEAPATVDGGDVLVTRNHVFVGQTTRSNAAAVVQFDRLGAPLRRRAQGIVVAGALHLKTAVTSLPDGSLIAVPGWVDETQFRDLGYVVHSAPEPTGGDVLCIDNTVILPTDAPETGAYIRSLGFDVEHINVSELQKIEAGVTCMSVLLP